MYHDVYLSQDAVIIAEATPETQGVYRERQPTKMTTYEPGVLDYGRMYYWRVDEVDNAGLGALWKGHIWSFKVIDAITPFYPSDDV